MISLIAAMAENRVIGGDNKLLWHISEDLKRFKALTTGKPVIMGRKTYDSIGRPLPNRPNIVITRQSDWRADGVTAVPSLEAAFKLAQSLTQDEIMVIGGAQIYKAALPFATRVYLTLVQGVYNGDAAFPHLDPKEWMETERQSGADSGKGEHQYSFLTYQRI